jgi:putative transposase
MAWIVEPKTVVIKRADRLFYGQPLARAERMKRSRFSEEQIIGGLKEAEATGVKAACAKADISDATYYNWKRKYGRMEVSEARRLRAIEEENVRLKRVVADQAVQIQILKEVNPKNW